MISYNLYCRPKGWNFIWWLESSQ